jgi:hypothetical protein
MNPAEEQEKEFIIPTRYKSKVASRLSWPVGAKELTGQFANVPQLKELHLSFGLRYRENQQGKLPIVFNVIEIRHRLTSKILDNDTEWEIHIHPVPRDMRARIREAFASHGFKKIVEWLIQNAKFSGSESYISYSGFWHSDIDELKFNTHDYVLPEISTAKQKRK